MKAGVTAPPPMTIRGSSSSRASSVTATGLAVVVLAVGAGITPGGGRFALLLSFAGLLAGVNLIAVGVWMAAAGGGTTGSAAAAFPRMAAFPRRDLAFVGLLMASAAVVMAVVAGDAGPTLCFGMLALLLLGVSLISTGVRGA